MMGNQYLTERSIAQLRYDHNALRQLLGQQQARLRLLQAELTDAGIVASVATTETVIPARSGQTPGGPVTAMLQRIDTTSGDFVDDREVEIYSYVKTTSADPANETGGKLWIFVTQDETGTWWFTGQDCTKPKITEECADLSGTHTITGTLAAFPGTNLTLPSSAAAYGWYNYTLDLLLRVTGVQGNQTWSVGVGLYSLTDAAWLKVWEFSGQGSPLNDIDQQRSFAFELDASNAGKLVTIGGQDLAGRGTIQAIHLDALGNPATGHCYRGPLQ